MINHRKYTFFERYAVLKLLRALFQERAQLHYGKNYTTDELETMFFDLELEMEKCYCRDLVSTCPHYENGVYCIFLVIG